MNSNSDLIRSIESAGKAKRKVGETAVANLLRSPSVTGRCSVTYGVLRNRKTDAPFCGVPDKESLHRLLFLFSDKAPESLKNCLGFFS